MTIVSDASAPTAQAVVEVRPAKNEVVLVHQPQGTLVRAYLPDGRVRDCEGQPDRPVVLVIAGDTGHLGWGAWISAYGALHPVRNGHNKLDLPVWHDAVKAVRKGGTVYVQYDQIDYFGTSRWTAKGLRSEVAA